MLNSYASNHKGVFKNYTPLVELEENQGNYLINLIKQYQAEIQTWIDRRDRNKKNRSKLFEEEGQALSKTLLDFFKANRAAFKIDDNHDLLEGYEDLKDYASNDIKVAAIQQLVHKNFLKAQEDGITLENILDKAKEAGMFKPEEIISQNNISISKALEYGKLTPYAKFQLFVASLVTDYTDFYKNLQQTLKDNPEYAPMPAQEYNAKLVFT